MKIIVFLLMTVILCASTAHADDSFNYMNGMGNVEITFRVTLLKLSRDGYASDWNKIEAKRKQFVQSGNTQMAQIAKEEADAAAQRYQSLDQVIKALELQKARNDLKN